MDQRDDQRQDAHAAGQDAAADADFHALAEDWIAIWQSELAAYLTDPETQAHWSAMLALWGEAAQTMMRGLPRTPGFASAHERRRPPAGADAAPGTAPTADASEPRDDEIRRLEQRVAELERRLAADAGRTDAGRTDTNRSRGPAGVDRRPGRRGRSRG